MTTLHELCEFIVDCEHKTAPVAIDGYPSIRTPNVGRGRLILESVNRVDEETYKQWTRRAIPRERDLIIAREAPVGNVAMILKEQQVCLGQRTVLVRPDPLKVHPEFLTYFMLGDYVQGQFQSASTGATVPHLNMRDIRGLEIPPLPLLPTQRRIASVLSAYDDLIENNTRRIAILEEMARRLYEEWFVKFRFPGHEKSPAQSGSSSGWRELPATEAFNIRYGKTLPKTKLIPEGQYPVYGGGGVIGRYAERITDGPTTLITSRGNGSGRVWRTHEAAFVTNNSFTVQPSAATFGWHYGLIQMAMEAAPISGALGGAAQPQLTQDGLSSVPVVVPPSILSKTMSDLVGPMFEMSEVLHRKNSNLRTQRDLLLPKLVSGEIDVSEAEDLAQETAA